MKLTWQTIRGMALGILLAASLAGSQMGCAGLVSDLEAPALDLAQVSVDELPPEAQTTVELIDFGGPFPYDKDGSIFHNYEGLLPPEADGYYREYTVETPGSSDRGARRIVAGADGERYYTDDHYESFRLIVE
ncbi:MAG: ribonuclease N1 [Dehalococcoidia bacterium]|nr:ribonuclease N1 [Dehalococcoidia bacterium]